MFLFIPRHIFSPLPFMVIASLTPHAQFLDANAPVAPNPVMLVKGGIWLSPTRQGMELSIGAFLTLLVNQIEFIVTRRPRGGIRLGGTVAYAEIRVYRNCIFEQLRNFLKDHRRAPTAFQRDTTGQVRCNGEE